MLQVVCKHNKHKLSRSPRLRFISGGVIFTEGELDIVLDGLVPIRRTNVVCIGNESSIAECSFDGANGDQMCTHADDVIVVCSRKQLL